MNFCLLQSGYCLHNEISGLVTEGKYGICEELSQYCRSKCRISETAHHIRGNTQFKVIKLSFSRLYLHLLFTNLSLTVFPFPLFHSFSIPLFLYPSLLAFVIVACIIVPLEVPKSVVDNHKPYFGMFFENYKFQILKAYSVSFWENFIL